MVGLVLGAGVVILLRWYRNKVLHTRGTRIRVAVGDGLSRAMFLAAAVASRAHGLGHSDPRSALMVAVEQETSSSCAAEHMFCVSLEQLLSTGAATRG